jgi:hypothetical protein
MRFILKTIIFAVILLLVFEGYKSYQNQTKQESKVVEAKTILHDEQGKSMEVEKLGFFANFCANFLIKISQSKTGQDLMLRLLQPFYGDADIINYDINQLFDVRMLNNPSQDQSDYNPCYCGSNVLVSYKVFKANELIAQENNVILHIGAGHIPALENALIGSLPSQQLTCRVPYVYANVLQGYMSSRDEQNNGLVLQITLHKVLGPKVENVKVFNSPSKRALCSEKLASKIKITDFKGRIIFDQSIKYRLGDQQYPLIFSYFDSNQLVQTDRSVIASARYLLKFDGGKFFTSTIKYNSDELVLIEFAPINN